MPIYTPGKVVLAKEFTWNETVWNPSMIQTALWLDAADASTVTTVSGAVSQWNDKSSKNRHATQATSNSRPAYSATGFNSKPCLTFDGADDWLGVGGSTIAGSGYHIALAFQPSAAALSSVDGDGVFWLRNAYGQNGFLHLLFRNNVPSYFRLLATSDGNVGSSVGRYLSSNATATAQILAFGGAQANLRLNGTLQANGSDGGGPGNSITYSSLLAEIGRYYDNSSMFNGAFSLAELILITLPSDALIEKLEGYLAHKWGLTANLPSDHPYKTVGPTP